MKTDSPEITIREAQISDLVPLLEMARKAFLEAFTAGNKFENVHAYLNEALTQSQFAKEMKHPASTFLVAAQKNQIIGYTKVNLTPAQTDIHDPESLEIARLYVLEDFLGSGLGKKLLDRAIHFAQQKSKKYVWLGVWERNQRAIRFYEKNGFAKFDTHPFPFGDEVQTDWLMRKEL